MNNLAIAGNFFLFIEVFGEVSGSLRNVLD